MFHLVDSFENQFPGISPNFAKSLQKPLQFRRKLATFPASQLTLHPLLRPKIAMRSWGNGMDEASPSQMSFQLIFKCDDHHKSSTSNSGKIQSISWRSNFASCGTAFPFKTTLQSIQGDCRVIFWCGKQAGNPSPEGNEFNPTSPMDLQSLDASPADER